VTDAGPMRALADRYWDRLIELEPMLGTESGDERYDDRLEDPTPAGRAAAEEAHRDALAELETIERSRLGASDRGTADVLEAIASRLLSSIEHRTDMLQVASHFWGPSQTLGEMASLQLADTPERLERYVARLRAIPGYLEAWREIAREGISAGVTSPIVVAERAVAQVERLVAIEPKDSPALTPVPEDDAAGRNRIVEVVRDVVNPAYERFLGSLRDYLPHATETIGLSALPGGDELYASQVRAWTSVPLDPAEVHRLGVERFAAIQEERRELAEALGYSSGAEAIAAHRASGTNTPASPEAYVELARDQVERSWEAAPMWFGRLPGANCEVRPVEPYREADMAGAFYYPPTEDGSRPGVYFINTFDLPSRDLHQLASITFHEANPGHHFQFALEMEMDDRPALRRFGGILAGSAFCEGWGLYSERLADEFGLYVDGWERLGMLENQAHRAARLITDTGIHALGWTRDQAVAVLEEGGLSHTDSLIEADRYIALPGQALSYMIGMIEIQDARAKAEAREGSSFSLRDFHDRVLALGQLPLPAFRREMAG
jgi:uncharacterized protein (DUF885 family)